jgi:hypothetical protein
VGCDREEAIGRTHINGLEGEKEKGKNKRREEKRMKIEINNQ